MFRHMPIAHVQFICKVNYAFHELKTVTNKKVKRSCDFPSSASQNIYKVLV